MDRRKICRYFQRGSCKKQKCPFVHLRESRKNCQFYMQGFCKKGANCNFYHPPKQSEEEKINRKNYKPTLQKKQKRKHQEVSQEQEQTQQYEKSVEEKVQIGEKQQQKQERQQAKEIQAKIQQPKHFQDQKGQKKEQQLTENFKNRQINFLLGLGQDSSSQQDQQQNQKMIQESQPIKRKPLNFIKIYPKKFPDYTKTSQSKAKILENQKLYFKGLKFIDLLSKTQDATQKQFYQIIRKFQDSFTIVQQQNSQKSSRFFIIHIRPLLYETEINLHFEMIQDFIQLKVDSRNYPQQRSKFQILNMSIPQQYKLKFVNHLNILHKTKSIFDTLKIFINSFEKIYEQIKSKLENQHYSQIELQQKINKKLSEERQKKDKKKERKEQKQKLQRQKQKEKEENPDLQIIKFPFHEKINVGNMNYEIKLESLLINNAEYVMAERFLLFLECQCEKRLVHILEADRKELKIGVKLKCKKCQIIISIAIQREVMQLRSQIIGRLGIDNGKLIEVGGIGWKIGCSCDAEIVKPRICMPGYRLNANCIQCFRSMQVSYMGLKFHNPFWKENELIEDGKQLSNKGACKHYKLSFRWIRYGCCGRTFSCDECHINGSIYPHQKIEGITMLCGYCSVQQPINTVCSHCKKDLVKGVDKFGHWQGGMGCRDKNLLSRKDAKKYSGLTKQQHK